MGTEGPDWTSEYLKVGNLADAVLAAAQALERIDQSANKPEALEIFIRPHLCTSCASRRPDDSLCASCLHLWDEGKTAPAEPEEAERRTSKDKKDKKVKKKEVKKEPTPSPPSPCTERKRSRSRSARSRRSRTRQREPLLRLEPRQLVLKPRSPETSRRRRSRSPGRRA